MAGVSIARPRHRFLQISQDTPTHVRVCFCLQMHLSPWRQASPCLFSVNSISSLFVGFMRVTRMVDEREGAIDGETASERTRRSRKEGCARGKEGRPRQGSSVRAFEEEGSERRERTLLLPDHGAPLIEFQRKVAVTADPLGIGRVHDRLGGRPNGNLLGQRRFAIMRHPGHFWRKALHVIFLSLQLILEKPKQRRNKHEKKRREG